MGLVKVILPNRAGYLHPFTRVNCVLIMSNQTGATQEPSFRRKPESRKSPGKERAVNPSHRRSGESRNPGNPPEKSGLSTQATVVPAKAGIQEIPRKRAGCQPKPPSFRRKPESRKSPGKERAVNPSHRRSGESRNPGNPPEKSGLSTQATVVPTANSYVIPTAHSYVIPTAGRNLKCRPLTTLKIFRFLPAVGMTQQDNRMMT